MTANATSLTFQPICLDTSATSCGANTPVAANHSWSFKPAKAGNYNFGFTEQTAFPEVNAAEVTFQQGMNITMVTTARNPDQGRELLRHFGMPFREHTKQDR